MERHGDRTTFDVEVDSVLPANPGAPSRAARRLPAPSDDSQRVAFHTAATLREKGSGYRRCAASHSMPTSRQGELQPAIAASTRSQMRSTLTSSIASLQSASP